MRENGTWGAYDDEPEEWEITQLAEEPTTVNDEIDNIVQYVLFETESQIQGSYLLNSKEDQWRCLNAVIKGLRELRGSWKQEV